jgi:hypothetical protein
LLIRSKKLLLFVLPGLRRFQTVFAASGGALCGMAVNGLVSLGIEFHHVLTILRKIERSLEDGKPLGSVNGASWRWM